MDFFLTTEPSGKLLLLSVLWVALMLLGAGAFIAAAKATNEDVPFGEAVWVSWTMLSDPGQQGAQDSIWKRVLSVVLTIKGLLLLALLVGLATDGVAKQVDDLNKGKGPVMERGHVLVVGWTPRTIPLVQQLVGADGSRAVVVLAGGKGKEEMDSALLDAIPKSERQKAGGGQLLPQIVTRTGSPFHSEDLARCAADAARSIVLLSPPVSDPSQADAFVIQASLALANRPDISADIIAELSSLSNVRLLQRLHRTLLAPSPSTTTTTAQAPPSSTASSSQRVRRRRLVPVAAENLSLRTLLSAAVHRGTADVTADLLDFENDEFYFKEWPELVGRTFGDALFLFDNATPCGLMKAPKQHTAPDASGAAGSSMGEVLVNPPSWTLIEAPRQHSTPDASSAGSTMGEVLVNPPSWTLIGFSLLPSSRFLSHTPSLARGQDKLLVIATATAPGPATTHSIAHCSPLHVFSVFPPPGDKLLVIAADRNSYRPGPSRLPPPPSELTAAAVPAATQKAPRGTSSSSVGGKQHVLICGWRPEAKQLVELLPSILAQGSEVTVVATHISPTDELLLGNIRRHKKLPIRIKRGSPADREVMESLPLETVDSVILLQSTQVNGGENGEDEEEDAGMVDSSQATVTALLIRSIQAARGRAQEAAIVAEVPASERDVARQVERHALDGAVCPEHLEAQVLAQITHDPDVGTVLDEIIGSERNRMAVRRADEFIGEHEAGIFNLWEMQVPSEVPPFLPFINPTPPRPTHPPPLPPPPGAGAHE
ncbi:unnamed protein product [Closterium sp. NIES-64]|nr:unnamed protein product [Closterium sp. NIES-64]